MTTRPRRQPQPVAPRPTDAPPPREVLAELLRPHAGRLALAAALSGAAGASAALLLATSFGLLTWAAMRPPVLHLLVAIVAVRALALVRAGARYGERLAGHDAALRVVDATRRWVWRHVSAHPATLVSRRDGDTLQALVADLDQVQQLLVAGLVPLGGAAVGTIVVVATAVPASPAVAAILGTGLAAAGAALAWAALRDGRQDGVDLVTARTGLTSAILDDLSAAEELAALGATATAADRLATRATAVGLAEARASHREAAIGALAATIAVATTVTVVVVAGHAGVDGRLLAAAAGLSLAGFELVAPVPVAARRAGEALAAVRRLTAVATPPLHPAAALTAPPNAATAPPNAATAPPNAATAPPDSHPSRDSTLEVPPQAAPPAPLVSLRGITVHGHGRPRCADVDLDLPPRARVAIVGPSGSGKTTLAQVLCGLLPPTHGTVASLEGAALRDLVALVPQAPHLLAGDVRANLQVADPDADDLTLLAVLARVGLDAWVAATPAGLDTVLGEAGHGLSAGQARRLATARALLAGRPVLILDEPTADLDPATARALVADLLAAADEHAVVMITHDRHAVGACDVVYAMRDGRLEPAVRSDGGPPPPPGHPAAPGAHRRAGWSPTPTGW